MSSGRVGTAVFTGVFIGALWVFAVWLANVRWGDLGATVIGASAIGVLAAIWALNTWRKPRRR